ncbi:MAG TPA: DUF1697 domain-containing protein [Clostridiales bacterium]|nr:MAG: hypothetical protein A2Y18_07240 [Clostridiales bacterium GWD2_32_19]HCC08192.1 DUF1697 domain-containing protein [Clostridiales bacterium]
MVEYIAFLKGINVSGQKMIKVRDLNDLFIKLGLKKVKTYIQSGNVRFESDESNKAELVNLMEKEIHNAFGYNPTVILKTIKEIEDLVDESPFKNIGSESKAKMYITFLASVPTKEYELPLVSSMKDVKVFKVFNEIVLSIVIENNERYYSPNSFIEKELGVPATTRDWETISKLID